MRAHGRRGVLLVVAIVRVVVVSAMVVTPAYLNSSSLGSSSSHSDSAEAYFVAHSGLERATAALDASVIANRTACASLHTLANVQVGPSAIPTGVFSIASNSVNGVPGLTAAVRAKRILSQAVALNELRAVGDTAAAGSGQAPWLVRLLEST